MSFYIVEKIYQLEELETDNECFIYIIPLNSFYHSSLTSPCLVYYRTRTGKGHIICVNHSESFSINFKDVLTFIKKHKVIYTLDSKHHKYYLSRDIEIHDINFNLEKPIILTRHNTTLHDYFYREYKTHPELEKIIPLTKQFEKFENIYNSIKDKISKNNEYLLKYVDIFYNIEKHGIQIDPAMFFKYFEPSNEAASIKNNTIYTHYNLYNNTTRPTNTFNGINFSALTKSSRLSFIPNNDMLMEFDYEAYHPRLISKLVNYSFNISKTAYEQLAELYFNDNSDESIKLAKEYTFKQLYGGIDEKYLNIEYFKLINEWKWFDERKTVDGFMLFGGKIIKYDELTINQLFNYMIQSLETFNNVQTLSKILPLLEDKKTKLIMYNYDAFILDISSDEKDIIKQIKDIISENYPIKILYGNNYRDMERIRNF